MKDLRVLTNDEILRLEAETRLQIRAQESELSKLAESRNQDVVLAKLTEFGTSVSSQLHQIFCEKRKRGLDKRNDYN